MSSSCLPVLYEGVYCYVLRHELVLSMLTPPHVTARHCATVPMCSGVKGNRNDVAAAVDMLLDAELLSKLTVAAA